MYEYSIYNKETKEEDIIYGYDLRDALRRRGLVEMWESGLIDCWHIEYVD